MARKHSKTGVRKVEVNIEIVTDQRTERKVILNPATGMVEVVHITTPAVRKQGKAFGSTRQRGQKNASENTAPKGRSGSAPAQQKRGKK
jgi:hypothetical protein